MGLNEPRTPAVHRATRLMDAIWSGQADSPAALVGALQMAKSSVADLLDAMEEEGLVALTQDGHLLPGGRWATLADTEGVVDRLLRACARTPELDGHTIAVAHLYGAQAVYVDVRLGRYPLPLTPRPGQSFACAESAAAIAVLSSLAPSTAAQIVTDAAAHQGLSQREVDLVIALRRGQRSSCELNSVRTGWQVAAAVPFTRTALVMHLPERFSHPSFLRRAARALNSAAREVRAAPAQAALALEVTSGAGMGASSS